MLSETHYRNREKFHARRAKAENWEPKDKKVIKESFF